LALPGLWLSRRQRLQRRWLCLGYPIVLFTVLTLFRTRTWYYPLQLLPFLSLWAALALCTLGDRYRQSRQSRWVVGLTLTLAALGTLMVAAGLAALVQPQWFPLVGVWRYGLVALGAGLGWGVPLAVYLWDRRSGTGDRHRDLWQLGWLLGPWGAIALLYTTGLWGNYNPEYPTAMATEPIQSIAAAHPIHAVFRTLDQTREPSVLITFYTPQPGEKAYDWRDLPPGGYAWVWADDLGELPDSTPSLGQVNQWHLVQLPPP
jgi:hypothetical protein